MMTQEKDDREQKAKQVLERAHNSQYSNEERCELAVELAEHLLALSNDEIRPSESAQLESLAAMMEAPNGKVFTARFTDQCFRSSNPNRTANQLTFLLERYGIPGFVSRMQKVQFQAFRLLGKLFAPVIIPFVWKALRKQTARVILAGETRPLMHHIARRTADHFRVNLNRLGEAILGESEAQKRTDLYLEDLARPEVEYISIKISTVCSRINVLAWDKTVERIADRLRLLYRAAAAERYRRPDNTEVPKFINLDMEEYRDLHLTVAVFRKVLDEPEFLQHSAGIVLQSYLPDSYLLQQELTVWAMERVARGGAPIKIRLVKGANLAMEQVDASLHSWPQTPYTTKEEVDANYRRMLLYACRPEHASAVRIGVASHNLFDIAFAMILREERSVQDEVEFEMLEGMADHMARVVQRFSGGMLLYCPAARDHEFQNAVAYLVRRLDENTAPQNFLRHLFDLKPDSKEWNQQVEKFRYGCGLIDRLSMIPRRQQNRFDPQPEKKRDEFSNEPDTDFDLEPNQKWIEAILSEWSQFRDIEIPAVINGKELAAQKVGAGEGHDPSRPGDVLYRYHLAESKQIEKALACASKAASDWEQTAPEERARLLQSAAQNLRDRRGRIIGAMVADGGKAVIEADREISEAIDFLEYYSRNLLEWTGLEDVRWRAKGVTVVTPPWNFPCAIPVGGMGAALAAGNPVIFKPAPEAILVGWESVQAFWDAGIPKSVLQFVTCKDDPEGSQLIRDSRVAQVVMTGATATAELFFRMRPDLDLLAETGGKNAIIVTAMSDRDLAARDIVRSAFGHNGQKCSACSVAILEEEVYRDTGFLNQLCDAAASLPVGSAWDPDHVVTPLIGQPNADLMQGLTDLEPGESWLLEPKRDATNPQLWSPGIKLGVKQGNFSQRVELFGPVLSLMCARDLEHAIELANATPYGLTSGLHSLDSREQKIWRQLIKAGNLYVNRGITGAIVQRQPFGGCKKSSFGLGMKTGGPNYLTQLMLPEQKTMPEQDHPVPKEVTRFAEGLKGAERAFWSGSVGSYAYFWEAYFSKKHDLSLLVGQDNFLYYQPHETLWMRLQEGDRELDLRRVCAAAAVVGASLRVSATRELLDRWQVTSLFTKDGSISLVEEDESTFLRRLRESSGARLRYLSAPKPELWPQLRESDANVVVGPVLANGRLELLYLLREVALSHDYHRYGNLGARENERRRPLEGTGCAGCKTKPLKCACD